MNELLILILLFAVYCWHVCLECVDVLQVHMGNLNENVWNRF